MQSFAGQGKGVGKSIVHALRAHGVSAQNPMQQRQQQQQAGAVSEPQAGGGVEVLAESQPAGFSAQSMDRLTSVQILQQLLDERAASASRQRRRQQQPEQPELEREEGVVQPPLAVPVPVGSGSSSGSSGNGSDAGVHGTAEEWLVLADAPMENARPFCEWPTGQPLTILCSFDGSCWVVMAVCCWSACSKNLVLWWHDAASGQFSCLLTRVLSIPLSPTFCQCFAGHKMNVPVAIASSFTR